ncbi:MAG: hypothetical protein QOI03_137 [Solirubrobacteraceae bacterium]|nr:hypothetical protein [Solirubrobacteraceae bacterium]
MQQTAASPASASATAEIAPAVTAPGRGLRRLGARAHPRQLALAGVLALSAVLNTHHLSQNGYANAFYSAGVKSMLQSLHNFVFVSFDPGGFITIDKPPLGLWLQVASAKLFGLSPLSLLLPEAIAGVLAVALLYRLLAPRLGAAAALAGALALAVFPSFVAVSRDNGVDPLLILLMLAACGAGLRAAETGRWRSILWCGVLVGLAFNTKTLAAFLVLPGLAVGFLVCAPGSIVRRGAQLLAALVVMAAVCFSWIAVVDATPAGQRPYVGSSTNNSEFGLTFGYNGFGRVGGQVGGPHEVPVLPGARLELPRTAHLRHRRGPAPSTQVILPNGRYKNPTPFGGPTGPLRLFDYALGAQAGWIVPFALFGAIALALLLLAERSASGSRGRRDPRLAVLLVLGGWFLVEALVLSMSKGIVHPYYTAALAPGAGAMVAAGAFALVALARGHLRILGIALAILALLATLAVEIVVLRREHYILAYIPILLAAVAVGVGAMVVRRRLTAPGLALALCALLVAPGAYASTTWLAPVEGTFPAAGTRAAAGPGGVGVTPTVLRRYSALIDYVDSHRPGTRWPLFADSAPTAAPFILLGLDAGSLAGYSGTDPAVDGDGFAQLVARGQARYVLLGGEFSSRGGNGATAAILRACTLLSPRLWDGPRISPYSLVLFDCAGHERELAGEAPLKDASPHPRAATRH